MPKIVSSSLYFVVNFLADKSWNERFVPLHGKGKSGGSPVTLPDDFSIYADFASYYAQKPATASYLHSNKFFTQAELPGWANDDVSMFGSW